MSDVNTPNDVLRWRAAGMLMGTGAWVQSRESDRVSDREKIHRLVDVMDRALWQTEDRVPNEPLREIVEWAYGPEPASLSDAEVVTLLLSGLKRGIDVFGER